MEDKLSLGARGRFAQYFWYAAGLILIIEAGSIICWNTPYFWAQAGVSAPSQRDMWPFLAVVASAYAGALAVTRRVLALPRCGRVTGVLFSASLSFALGAILLFFARAYYSRPFLLIAFAAALVWIYAGHRLFFSVNQIRYGFAPGSLIQELRDEWRGNFVEIPSPESGEMFDILVVAPYQDKPLPPEWARYVANVMIHGAPMVHPGTVYEFFAGRLPLKYMEEGPGVYIRPPRGYFLLKRACDWAMLIALLVPAMLCVGAIALAILLTSGRPVFFVQERIGKGGAPFRMMKFRSMTGDGEITDIGRRLRKYRLDELPQIWNVLRGEMSFIGPRPETPELTRLYTERIPFYPYRYSVPPGITGWAQVNFGYASDTSENRVKLSYDLYYVKHASLALDALIILKTVVTMLLGFGAK